MKQAELLTRRRASIGPSLSVSYKNPLTIVRGSGQYLYDPEGNEYLDCVNNVCHVGHSHPRVVAAAHAQAAELNTNTRYLHPNILEYAERLTGTLPEGLDTAFFVCSGSEANELALRLARTASGTRNIIAVDAAYHGNTGALIDISSYKHGGPGGDGPPPHVSVVPLPDVYRGKHRDPTTAGHEYARYVSDRVGESPTSFIVESLPGCGGQIVLPEGYLKEAFQSVRAAGGVCIADEVQCGFGRVGEAYWGFELQQVVPDIVTLGKPIGNGHPMAAVVTTRAIAEAFDNGMEYFNTFGGNPVSCAVGLAVLDVIEEEGLLAHALQVGERLMAAARELSNEFAQIGDVRGKGLFIGIELVNDPDERLPDAALASELVEAMRSRNILLSTDGPDHNVIKIKPPLPFSAQDADRLVTELASLMRARG
jgi:4-aminobutyrate aminotransferase-like enzyme